MPAKLIVAVDVVGHSPQVAAAIVLPAAGREPCFTFVTKHKRFLLRKRPATIDCTYMAVSAYLRRTALSVAVAQSHTAPCAALAGMAVVRALERLRCMQPEALRNVAEADIWVYTMFKQRIPYEYMRSLSFVRGIKDWRLNAAHLLARTVSEHV